MAKKYHYNSNNQTVFIDQAPLWQKTSQNKINLKSNLTKNKNLKPFYFLMAGVFLMFAFYIIAVFIPKRQESVINPKPELEEAVLEASPLERRVSKLQDDLKIADPTRQTLAFPNINFKIRFP